MKIPDFEVRDIKWTAGVDMKLDLWIKQLTCTQPVLPGTRRARRREDVAVPMSPEAVLPHLPSTVVKPERAEAARLASVSICAPL